MNTANSNEALILREYPFLNDYADKDTRAISVQLIDFELLGQSAFTVESYIFKTQGLFPGRSMNFCAVDKDGKCLRSIEPDSLGRVEKFSLFSPKSWRRYAFRGETVSEALDKIKDFDKVAYIVQKFVYPHGAYSSGPENYVTLHKLPNGKTLSGRLSDLSSERKRQV